MMPAACRQPGGNYIVTEIGPEKRCSRCEQFWPADDEFFSTRKANKYRSACLDSWCRACKNESSRQARYIREAAATATEPRSIKA